jgi:hypothetical protein
MEAIIEEILNFVIQQENKMVALTDNIEMIKLNAIERKLIDDLRKLSEKNILSFERNLSELTEFVRIHRIKNMVLDDFNIEIPDNVKNDHPTLLLLAIKFLTNFIRVFTKVLDNVKDNSLKKNIPIMIAEKQKLKLRLESLYDEMILSK